MRLATLLQRCSWAEYLGRIAGPTLLALCIASLVRDPSLRLLLKQLIVACFIGAFAAKEIADFPGLWRRAVSAYRSTHHPLHLLSAVVAPEPAGWLRTVARLLVGSFHWAAGRRPPAGPSDGIQIPYLKRSGYGALLPLAVLSLVVEVPVSMLLLPAMGVADAHQSVIRIALIVTSLATVACVLGDRWHLSTGTHRLNADTLFLNVGLRFRAAVPLRAIERAELIGRAERGTVRWSRRELQASPFDRANVRLVLTDAPVVEAAVWGCAFRGVRCIHVYVDEPHALLAQLRGGA